MLLLIGVLCAVARPASAQTVDVGGRIYMDYYYLFSEPSETIEGRHGFTFRRLYLTTDFRLSEAFSGRARLEANEGLITGGEVLPYVKDLYLTWESDGGHAITGGITQPPVFNISSAVWGYRSLDKTLLNLNDVAPSRDFGIRIDGPLTETGWLRYAVMYANNNGRLPEDNRGKRLYGQLEAYPTERLVFTVGADYGGYFENNIETGWEANALAAYVAPTYRVGVEGYWQRHEVAQRLNPRIDPTHPDEWGVSLFGVVRLAEDWEAVARVDRAQREVLRETIEAPGSLHRTYALLGLAFRPQDQVRLIPNLRYLDDEPASGEVDPHLQSRLTLHVDF